MGVIGSRISVMRAISGILASCCRVRFLLRRRLLFRGLGRMVCHSREEEGLWRIVSRRRMRIGEFGTGFWFLVSGFEYHIIVHIAWYCTVQNRFCIANSLIYLGKRKHLLCFPMSYLPLILQSVVFLLLLFPCKCASEVPISHFSASGR